MSSNKSSSEKTYVVKYIIVGNSGVGKTQILLRYTKDQFKEEHTATVGIEFLVKNEKIGDNNYKLKIFDTSSEEQFLLITEKSYKDSACAILVYDITNKESYNSILNWLNLPEESNEKIKKELVLIGNKSDLEAKREVTKKEAEEFAKNNNMLFFETSAKDNLNIKEAFISSIQRVDNNIHNNLYDLNDEKSYIQLQLNESQELQLDQGSKSFCCFC